MNATIITSESSYGKFIQKGFLNENVSATVIDFDELDSFLYAINSDVFLFYISDPIEKYKSYVDLIRSMRDNCLIVLLTDSSLSRLKHSWIKESFDLIFYKPFSYLTIAFEVKYNICTMREKKSEKELRCGKILLDLKKREAYYDGNKITLRNKEFILLQYLIINRDKILTRPEILEHVWDYNTNILTNTIDVHISRLRHKLNKFKAGDLIKTVPCVGYVYEPKK